MTELSEIRIFRRSRKRVALSTICAVAFVALGISIMFDPLNEKFYGGLIMAVIALTCVILVVYMGWLHPTVLRLSPDGIRARSTFLPWSEISSVHLNCSRYGDTLAVTLKENASQSRWPNIKTPHTLLFALVFARDDTSEIAAEARRFLQQYGRDG